MNYKILLAEDEPIMGKLIKEALELRGFDVLWAQDGLKAYSTYRTYSPDACVFDVMMPHKDGFTLAREIREIDAQIPIIFLTAKSTINDLADGFQSGANDYIKKPFSMEELIIRINALLERNNYQNKTSETNNNTFQIGNYEFNFQNQTLCINGEIQNLSYRESQLIKMLIEHKESILDRKTALDYIWGDDSYFNSRSMDVFISKLRKFLEKDERIKILNVRGKGFKLIIN